MQNQSLKKYTYTDRPAKSSNKAEDLPLLEIFFKSSAFPIYFEIISLFTNFTGHSKYNTPGVLLFNTSFVISVQFRVKTDKIISFFL